jgi:uncharacterized OB-fold protein
MEDLEADEFAARLLMPERLILKSQFSSYQELSKEFLVSDQACYKRLNNLKRLDLCRIPARDTCPQCGNSQISPVAEYCEICGEYLPAGGKQGVRIVEYTRTMADRHNRVIFCPVCGNEEFGDGAKFCKKCGAPLKKTEMSHESMINSMAKESNDNTTKYIIVALIIVAVVLAGAFVYIYGFGNNNKSQDTSAPVVNGDSDDSSVDEAKTTDSAQSTPSTTSMSILSGSFSTGGGLSDKTYASIYVGPEHAGENVKIQIWYSRDGSTLNNGNMVPKTVTSSGYIEVASADAYKYFPDFAEINLYDNSGNLLDTQSVSLNPEAGTQTF